jgi:hypothetical protein
MATRPNTRDTYLDSSGQAVSVRIVEPVIKAAPVVPVNTVAITNLSNSPTNLASKGNSIYDLVEFEADGLMTGEINPDAKDYSKYNEFEKNSLGVTVIDKNKDISSSKTIINLYTAKPSNEKFNQVVDIEFTEFVSPIDSPLTFLEARLGALESTNAKTGAEKASLNREIAQLQAEIVSLRDQLALAVDPGRNNIVSDTLAVGGELISIEDGTNGRPVKNILLSRNRMAKGKMQGDGNFVIFTGNYDFNGNPIGPENIVWSRGFDNKQDLAPARFMVFKLSGGGNGRLETVRVDGTNYFRTWFVGDTLTSKARVQLTDAGILNLYDGPNVIWSSYGT